MLANKLWRSLFLRHCVWVKRGGFQNLNCITSNENALWLVKRKLFLQGLQTNSSIPFWKIQASFVFCWFSWSVFCSFLLLAYLSWMVVAAAAVQYFTPLQFVYSCLAVDVGKSFKETSKYYSNTFMPSPETRNASFRQPLWAQAIQLTHCWW